VLAATTISEAFFSSSFSRGDREVERGETIFSRLHVARSQRQLTSIGTVWRKVQCETVTYENVLYSNANVMVFRWLCLIDDKVVLLFSGLVVSVGDQNLIEKFLFWGVFRGVDEWKVL
jgi:hypothetical protein